MHLEEKVEDEEDGVVVARFDRTLNSRLTLSKRVEGSSKKQIAEPKVL